MQKHQTNNSRSSSGGMKKIVIGIISIIVLIAAITGIVLTQMTGEEISIEGKIDDINMEAQNIVVREVHITETVNGPERNEIFYTVAWDENTEFTTNLEFSNLNLQNEVFSPEARVKVTAKDQLTDKAALAQSIQLIERAPFRE